VESFGWGAAGVYVLKLSEFTREAGAAREEGDFEIASAIERDGPEMRMDVKPKDVASGNP
jgi:hypothetical protein